MRRKPHLFLLALMAVLLAVAPTYAQDGGTRFGSFRVGEVQSDAKVPAYSADADLGNIVLSDVLTADQRAYLARNLFVVSPSQEKEFFTIYEKARYGYQPLFITTDSLLHSYHLMFSKILRTVEAEQFLPLLRELTSATYQQMEQFSFVFRERDSHEGIDDEWIDAYRMAKAHISLAVNLAHGRILLSDGDILGQVQADFESALAAEGISPSAIFPDLPMGEDWTQYKPRGHYTRSEDLEQYFRAMMWLGRMTFRLENATETKAAVILSMALQNVQLSNGRSGLQAWEDLYAPTVFFVGRSDDLTIPQYVEVIQRVYEPTEANFLRNMLKIVRMGIQPFQEAAAALPSPRILNTVITDEMDIDKETKGMRFMGQRFVWDAYVFRQMIYRNVGTRDVPRRLPDALDVFAAMGSERALDILKAQGDADYENYLSQMAKVRGEVAAISEAEWTETLAHGWLYTINTLGQPYGEGYPSFMRNEAYLDRSLYAAMGSYAELKHDTLLYAEQAYAEMGGGGGKMPPPEPVVPPNYVEPVPLFWARLAALAEMTREGLALRYLITPKEGNALQTIADLARRFQRYAEKQLRNEPLNAFEQNELRFYGGLLEKLYEASTDLTDPNAPPSAMLATEPRAALISDIATDPDRGEVLQLGTGNVFNIYAVVPIEGKLWLARGAVFSVYQFRQPISERLTNEAWWGILDSGDPDRRPSLPAWTRSFLSQETIEGNFALIIKSVQNTITNDLWYEPKYSLAKLKEVATPNGAQQWFIRELTALVENGHYEGRQIIETNIRSVDFESRNRAIIAVRETWRGYLHQADPDEEYVDGPLLAQRLYTIDTIYTLERNQYGGWSAVNIVTKGAIPDWTPVQP